MGRSATEKYIYIYIYIYIYVCVCVCVCKQQSLEQEVTPALPTPCTYVYRTIITIHGGFYLLTSLCNQDALCLL